MSSKNALAIGVSNLEYLNILLTYYPTENTETFDVYLLYDNVKVTEEQIREVIGNFNIDVFTDAVIIPIIDLYDYYTEKHNIDGMAKQMLYNHGCIFKILSPLYLNAKYGVDKTYISDDDVFIFKDLSYMFDKFQGFGFKKENLFSIRNSNRYLILNAFNDIFQTDFSLEHVNSLSLNAGNLMFTHDPKMEEFFLRFIYNPYVHHMYTNFKGYTSWTIEQRFQHFNLHRMKQEGYIVDQLESVDLRLVTQIDNEALEGGYIPKFLKKAVPALIHYAVGTKKPIFLRQFLQGIEWRTGIHYEPKYELKDILYDETWTPPSFKQVEAEMKKRNSHITKSVF